MIRQINFADLIDNIKQISSVFFFNSSTFFISYQINDDVSTQILSYNFKSDNMIEVENLMFIPEVEPTEEDFNKERVFFYYLKNW